MEFDNSLSKIQGALLSLQKRKLLNSEVSGDEVITTLKDTIINMTDDEKRKIVYYMVLNTQLSVTDKLKEDENVYLFINDPILLEKNYLIDYVNKINLNNYLFDVIENCSSTLTTEIIEELIVNLKNSEKFCSAEYIVNLWKAIFVKINKTENCIEEDEKLLDFFIEVYKTIKLHVTECDKLNPESFKQYAEFLYIIFDSFLYFINLENHTNITEMYKLNVFQNCKNVKNLSEKCRNFIIDEFYKILQEITFESWMELSNYDKEENKTYQEVIGNIAYYLCEFEKIFPPDIINVLSSIKIKPKTSEIMNNINKGEEKWFKHLIQDLNLTDLKSLEYVLEKMELADDEDVELILEKTQNCDTELIKKIFLNYIKSSKQISKWFKLVLDKQNETETFNEDLIETFNKISNQKVQIWDVLLLFLQNSLKTLIKICETAVYNPNEIDFLVEILKQVSEYNFKGRESFGEIFLNILNEFDYKYVKNLVKFVRCLKKENLIGGDFFIMLIEKIENNLKDCNEVTQELEVVKSVVDVFLADCEILILLCEMSELIEYFSWDLYTFSKIKTDGREIIEDIVDYLLKELKKKESCRNKLDFLQKFISQKSEASQAVFCDLWYDFGGKWMGAGKYHSLLLALAYTNQSPEFLIQTLKEPKDFVLIRSSVVISLYMVLPVLTYRKWETIFSRLLLLIPEDKNSLLEVFDIFLSVLYFFSEKLNSNKKVLPCYEQSVRNIGRLIKSFYKKNNADFAAVLIGKILFSLSAVDDKNIRKNCSLILSSVLLELVEVVKNGEDESLRGKLELELEILDVEEVVDATKKKLSD